MATIGNKFVGLLDYAQGLTSNRQTGRTIEALHQLNPLMLDAHMEECNDGTSHTSFIRTGLGDVGWGKLYQGIPQSKATKQQVKDTTGFVERMSTIDTRMLELAGSNAAALRNDEANAALEAISQDVQSNFFYADTATTPERFLGLAPRYNAITNGGAAAAQIVDGGGTGSNNTSIWMVTWGPNATRLIYPEGSQAGIVRRDMGVQRVLDDNNLPYFAKEEYFKQSVGVSVGDWRYNVRIANIDVPAVRAGTVDLFGLLRQAIYRNQNRRVANIRNGGTVNPGTTVFYMNRDMMAALDALQTNSGATDNKIRLTPDEIAGKEVNTYRGFIIRETDALINNEARVV
jgi:hypothetical protein